MMNRVFVESRSSGVVRDAITSQHAVLRGLLADTLDMAGRQSRSRRRRNALRARARHLCHTVEAQMTLEERALPVALRDVIGWGAALRAQIEADHERRRHALASVLSALEPAELSWAELAANVRAFAVSVLRDLEREEAGLLHADLDALADDSGGG
jgi:hypothetical protein